MGNITLSGLCVLVLLLSVLAASTFRAAQGPPIDTALAQRYFQEAQAISMRDNGALWRRSLYGPMIFVDPATRAVVANQADAAGSLTRQGDIFVGRLPDEENVANTAVRWAGVRWTMILWPLPQDRQERARLMMHESFHRIQDDLKLPGADPSNSHLDGRDGRIWLQLEWRALVSSLVSEGVTRRRAVEDALTFRFYRHSLFPQAAAEERGLEINEGLAEYTGIKLSTASKVDFASTTICELRNVRLRPSYARSFAYVSGPAYGGLLDESGASWRQRIKAGDDLGLLLQQALSLRMPQISQTQALNRAHSYDGETLIASETRRENIRQQQLAKYRERFQDQPVLILPFTETGRYSFNPNNVVALDTVTTVYPGARVSDVWGVLEAPDGALLVREGGRVVRVLVTVPKDPGARPLGGEGWNLNLNEEWEVVAADRRGDLTLRRKE